MSSRNDKLAEFLREVSNWYWLDFVKAEHDTSYTTNQAMIFGLIRACAMRKMAAIRLSLNRLDGKLKTPVRIEYPKAYYIYPNATLPPPTVTNDHGALLAPPADGHTTTGPSPPAITGELLPAPAPPPADAPERDLPSMSLRETLQEMSDYPRELPQQIVDLALQVEQAFRGQIRMPDEVPRVKSVVAAHLLIMAQDRNIDALTEVFDQIDGKLVETIQVIGEDIYITMYSNTAPPDAYLNENGVLQVEATAVQQLWTNKLGG
jgi:hypothetical protein